MSTPCLDASQVSDLLDSGWTQDQIIKLYNDLCKPNNLPVSKIVKNQTVPSIAVLAHRYLVYSDTSLHRFNRALSSCDLPTEVECYVDGSGTSNAPTGIGVAIKHYDGWLCYAENIGLGTNNTAELTAIWRALRAFPDIAQPLLIRSDSQYAIGMASSYSWAPQKNQELIADIRFNVSTRGKHIRFEHVSGHAGVLGNEIADGLARAGRKWG